MPFSLGQVHVAEGEPDVWVRPEADSGLLALQVGVVVRDRFPDRFLDVHEALFALRHDEGRHLEDEAELRRRARRARRRRRRGVRRDRHAARRSSTVRDEHTAAADDHDVWGVPTFIQGDQRRVRAPDGPPPGRRRRWPTRTIERVVDLLGDFPELNEFKHTSLKR